MIRILVPATVSFVVGILATPVLTRYLYQYKAWKKTPGKKALDGKTADEFNRLHNGNEVRAPRMGGIIVWGSVVITILVISLLAHIFPDSALSHISFLSRTGTWVPLATLLVGSLFGLLDDLLVIRPGGNGLALRWRLLVVVLLSFGVGWWFWAKLGVTAINVPFAAPIVLGPFIVPFFILMSLALYASGVIDGIDGLSGGVFASIFASYTIIAFFEHQYDLASFCVTLVGALLAFLWFNIPPARFYMTDTGTMGLTLTLACVALMTDSLGGGYGVSVLPVIGALLVITVASDIAQILSKKLRGKKLLRIAPLHHHFEAIGWPGYKVVMRYWVLSIMFAVAGVILALSAM